MSDLTPLHLAGKLCWLVYVILTQNSHLVVEKEDELRHHFLQIGSLDTLTNGCEMIPEQVVLGCNKPRSIFHGLLVLASRLLLEFLL